MPADGLYAQVIGHPRFDDIFTLKRYWKVSAVAMVQRLWHLGIISEWHYRTWMVELSRRGFRSSEPNGIRPEGSILLRQLFGLAREDGWSNRSIASALHIPRDELEGMVFGRVHSQGAGNWRQLMAGSGGSQGLAAMAMASSAVMPWAAAESR